MQSRPVLFVATALAICLAFSRVSVPVRAQGTMDPASGAAVYNVRVVTDASPDLTDLQSFVASTTSRCTAVVRRP